MRDALLDPNVVRRLDPPDSERPRNGLRTQIVGKLSEPVNRNVCELIDIADIAGEGAKGARSLMGVAKTGNDRDSGPQRLIMNVKVSSWAQVTIAGDTPQLPTSGQWRCLVLEDGETLCGLPKA